MAGISAIGSSDNIYGQIASGRRINSAADDASGLAISQKMEKEIGGLTQGGENASEGVNALNIADGAMGQITDSLQRVYELSVKAANTFMYGDEEISAMQDEASQLLEGVSQLVQGTNYNEKNLLGGENPDMHIASNPNGSGQDIEMVNASLAAIGMDNFDISSSDAIKQVSDALTKISGGRASLGAASVSLEYAKNYSAVAAENTLASKSRLEDLDIPKAVSEKEKKRLLQDYQTALLKKQQEDKERQKIGLFQF